ncbi:MAG: YdbL family protein [Alphaproteobacteria bacterium]
MPIIFRRLRIFPALFLAVALAFGSPAIADELDDAKASGAVGETYRGYIAPVSSPTPAVSALVDRINAGRRAQFEDIAARNDITLEQVELLTGQRVFERAAGGTYLMDASGAWAQK